MQDMWHAKFVWDCNILPVYHNLVSLWVRVIGRTVRTFLSMAGLTIFLWQRKACQQCQAVANACSPLSMCLHLALPHSEQSDMRFFGGSRPGGPTDLGHHIAEPDCATFTHPPSATDGLQSFGATRPWTATTSRRSYDRSPPQPLGHPHWRRPPPPTPRTPADVSPPADVAPPNDVFPLDDTLPAAEISSPADVHPLSISTSTPACTSPSPAADGRAGTGTLFESVSICFNCSCEGLRRDYVWMRGRVCVFLPLGVLFIFLIRRCPGSGGF